MNLVEDYLKYLNMDLRPMAKEWNGPSIPVEGDDRPNWIRQCTTMLEHPKMKINCLRRLRDQAAMNPYYQHRIDRYIDEITDTYEPTDYPGTIPGNEFKETGVGEDTPLQEASKKQIAFAVLSTANIIMLSVAAYRDFFSKVARQCSSKKFDLSYKKEICMTKARILAFKYQIRQLTSDLKKCNKTKNPANCRTKINERIKKLKRKIASREAYAKKILSKVRKESYVSEGLKDKLLCKRAKVGIKMNKDNYLNPAKEGLKNCIQYKKTNPARYQGCVNYYSKVIKTTEKAIASLEASAKKHCGK